MEKELYDEYGEEFVVENIGLRTANGEKFYQARIYPKSIIGTPKEDDDYYYSTASVDLTRFNEPNSVGNSYGVIKMNDEAEEYLLPKARELFGERIKLKADVEYKIKDGDFFTQYLVAGFEEKREEALKNPNTHRFILTLYIYIFDKIDNEEEKEERRKQLFEFLQYLRGEGLDRYLKIFMVFTDEIILAPSFEKEEYNIENNLDISKNVSIVLTKEFKQMNNEKIIEVIDKFSKSELLVSNTGRYHRFIQSDLFIITMDMLEIDEYGRYDEAKKNNTVERHNYKKASDIEFSYWDSYIFKEGK